MKIQSAFACALLLCVSAAASARPRTTYPMELPVGPAHIINFNVQEGEFRLRGDPNATSIHMNVSIDRFFIFKLGERDILQKLIHVTGQGTTDALTVATDIPRSLSSWGRAQYPIDFEVVVPASMNVRLRDTSGAISIRDVTGDVDVDDGSGVLNVASLGGSLRVVKTSGDIRVQQVRGKTEITSRSGQIHVGGAGALDIDESSGNVDVGNVESARIHNTSGNLTVLDVAGPVTIDDTSGEITVRNVHGNVNVIDTSGQVRTADTGAVTVSDTSGDITVEHAPALQVSSKESGEVRIRQVAGVVDVPTKIKVKREN